MKVTLNWQHILKADQFDDHLDFFRKEGGVYTWIFEGNPERVTYIGEAACFGHRFMDHFSNHLGMRYCSCDIGKDEDYVQFYAENVAGKGVEEFQDVNSKFYYPCGLETKKPYSSFLSEKWLLINQRYINNHKFAFATIEADGSEIITPEIRKKIEGGLIWTVRDKYEKKAGRLLPKPARSNNTLVGSVSRYPTENIKLEHVGKKNEIPEEVRTIDEIRPS